MLVYHTLTPVLSARIHGNVDHVSYGNDHHVSSTLGSSQPSNPTTVNCPSQSSTCFACLMRAPHLRLLSLFLSLPPSLSLALLSLSRSLLKSQMHQTCKANAYHIPHHTVICLSFFITVSLSSSL